MLLSYSFTDISGKEVGIPTNYDETYEKKRKKEKKKKIDPLTCNHFEHPLILALNDFFRNVLECFISQTVQVGERGWTTVKRADATKHIISLLCD